MGATFSFNDRVDETTELVKLALPAPHFLESWGDAEPKPGFYSFLQPTIAPLFKSRPFEENLLKWSGSATTYDAYFKQYWINKLGSTEAYEKALQEGVIEPASTTAGAASYNAGKVSEAAGALNKGKASGFEVVLYQKVSMGIGAQANNPWLLELPDPITKATWDNYAVVSPKFLKDNFQVDLSNRRQADGYEVYPDKTMITVKVGNGKPLTLPVVAIPGTQNDTIGIAVGFGRQSAKAENTSANIGRAAEGAGWNVFPLATYNGSTIEWTNTATFEKAAGKYKVAQTQTHMTYEGRVEVVKEVALETFVKNREVIIEEREKELKPFGGLEKFREQGTLYPTYDNPGIKWGMSIDMNACYGCGACVVACHAENNVPVVGKSEVLRFHDMHWLRIDRYFSASPNSNLEDPNDVQVLFQPMLCQHCDNAPCENVCPVNATNHSSEGLNQMAYNRCIGTRYCANNCPYKVRRFNWADYTGADSFENNQDQTTVGKLDPAVFQMNDDLTRMVLNPDVTVRSRGVMEKCSFCVQRLQEGKLKAKKENRPLKDMQDVQTACQQACASDAIVFGNVNDKESLVSKTRQDNSKRLFYVIEETHTLPNVSYLAKVRNTDVVLGTEGLEEEEEHPGKEEHAKEEKHS